MELTEFIIKSIVVLIIFAVTLGIAMYSTWGERKVAAFIQDRPGPNRAGWGGDVSTFGGCRKDVF